MPAAKQAFLIVALRFFAAWGIVTVQDHETG
jgi:hypothetical protein